MDELKEKGQPRQTELIAALEGNSDKLSQIIDLLKPRDSAKINEIVILLTSLNHYHGNPESHKGWLEDLYKTTKCEKKETKKHRSTGLIFAALVTVAALVGESVSKGESSVFIIALKFAKELVL